jgi:hypothetical protein
LVKRMNDCLVAVLCLALTVGFYVFAKKVRDRT